MWHQQTHTGEKPSRVQWMWKSSSVRAQPSFTTTSSTPGEAPFGKCLECGRPQPQVIPQEAPADPHWGEALCVHRVWKGLHLPVPLLSYIKEPTLARNLEAKNVGKPLAPGRPHSPPASTLERSLMSARNVGRLFNRVVWPHQTPADSQWREALWMHGVWKTFSAGAQTSFDTPSSTLERSPASAVSVERPSVAAHPLTQHQEGSYWERPCFSDRSGKTLYKWATSVNLQELLLGKDFLNVTTEENLCQKKHLTQNLIIHTKEKTLQFSSLWEKLLQDINYRLKTHIENWPNLEPYSAHENSSRRETQWLCTSIFLVYISLLSQEFFSKRRERLRKWTAKKFLSDFLAKLALCHRFQLTGRKRVLFPW